MNSKAKLLKANIMTLNGEAQVSSWGDRLKWLAVLIILLVSLVGNYYYSALSLPLRVIGWVAVFGISAAILSFTTKGRLALEFFRESRIEMRKVVWPTRQETVQTTLVVGVVVVIIALVLWVADGILLWLVGWLTGQHG